MNYIQGLFAGVKTLGVGLKTTMRELFTKKITEQYPENRKELVMFDRFRGRLIMPHNEKNEHKCIACGLCQNTCPNDTIKVVSEMVEVDGKKKKQLVKYEYDLGRCMFCMLCVRVCPQNAIAFDQEFENAVFDRAKLVDQLNKPGSKCEERKPVARPAAKPAVAPATAAPAKPAAPAAAAKPEAPKTEAKETVAEKPQPLKAQLQETSDQPTKTEQQ